MKKTLIAFAVFGAFSSAALADGDSVQLYGTIDLGLTHFTGLAPSGGGRGTTSTTNLSSGVQSPSAIGLKGSEDLGGGLRALFEVETGFCAAGLNQNADTMGEQINSEGYCSGPGFMQRHAWVGLSGDFGLLRAGRMTSLQYDNEANYVDPFGWGMTGGARDLSPLQRAGDVRLNQTVTYIAPQLGGFTAAAAYSFAPSVLGTLATASGPGSQVARAWSLDGRYASGPLTAGLSYATMQNNVPNPVTSTLDGSSKIAQIYGGYDFGVSRITAEYVRLTEEYMSGAMNYWMLGADVPLGPGSLLISFGNNRDSINMVQAESARKFALGYSYALSRRTNLYTSYARISNRNGAAFAVGSATDYGGANVGVANTTSSGFALGLRHMF